MGLAKTSSSPDEATAYLREAADQASAYRDWEAIFGAFSPMIPDADQRRFLRRARDAALEHRDIWGFRTVAVAEVCSQKDDDAARETLRAGERMLLAEATEGAALGYAWGVLAGAYDEIFRDEESVRRCLDAGFRLSWDAHDVENLGRLANAWCKLLRNKDEAVEKLRAVEAAAMERGDLRGLIYWWHALGEPGHANHVRQTILDATESFTEVLDLARFWKLYDKESPGMEKALARAEQLATSAEEWLELVQQARYPGNDDAMARRALDQAAQAATTPETRARIATAYVAWFDDPLAAERVGPRGLHPGALSPRLSTLAGWQGSASSLFDSLRRTITTESLRHIAAADYGDATEKHLEALESICQTGLVPPELPWHPGEVVELTRWSSGEGVDHVARAFCCALLCLGSADGELTHNGPILVESCLALGGDAADQAEALLVWCYERHEPDADEAWVAVFCLFVSRVAHEPGDPRLPGLLRHLLVQGDAVRGLREWMATSMRADLWAALLDRYVTPLHQTDPALSPLLAALGF